MAKRGSLTWLWVMVAAAVLTQTALNLLRPVTSYKLLTLGADETAVGLATAAYAIVPLVSAMWLGRVTGRLGSLRGMIALGAAVMAAAGAALAWSDSVLLVMVASALLGMGHLVFTIAGQAAIGRRAPAELMDAAFGWFTAAFSVGQMAGPLLSGLILGSVPLAAAAAGGGLDAEIGWALWLGAGVALLAVPVMYALRPPAPHRTGPTAAGASPGAEAGPGPSSVARATVPRILRVPGIPSHMLAALALLAVIDILTAFLPLVGEAAGVPPLWVGILLAVRGGGSVLSRVFLPWFSARWSRNALVLAALWISAATIALVPLALEPLDALWLAVALMAVGGAFLGLGQPLTMTLISQAVPDSWRGAALGLRLVGNRLGQVLLPAAAGLVAAPLGPAGGVWFACAVLAASGTERLLGGRARGTGTPSGGAGGNGGD
ncbi:MFS transporter [Citricoccus sp. SGAir0253]|uniref:MFS transporter n=1 Tax=Citricoccus sp. SGAir0253 TaxID=2567881 RepID=UPI0010CCBF4C|nr:MFS transporter [Citricoccus sp. SGAir0253]QCU77216.1 MFS transporter [Citricoccus sp. SGAir0253]